MANHASALKRHRQSLERRKRNQAVKTRVRHLIRSVRAAVGAGDAAAAQAGLADAARALDKAVSKGVIHRNGASRRVSRLTRAVTQLASSTAS